jgi:K+-sensing histidine kinase KdpD
MSYNFESVDLTDEVRAAVEAAEALHTTRRVTYDVPDGQAFVLADADRLHQVMTNLIDNAAKNSPPEAPIDVRLRTQAGKATVTVTDAGPGFDTTLGPSVFDKFVRGRGSTVSGTGLGLYVSRLVIEAHHGTISAGTADGGKTQISFELPIDGAHRAETIGTGHP